MQRITNISEAKVNLCRLIKIVRETNEPIIIGKAGQPIAILSAYKVRHHARWAVGGREECKWLDILMKPTTLWTIAFIRAASFQVIDKQ